MTAAPVHRRFARRDGGGPPDPLAGVGDPTLRRTMAVALAPLHARAFGVAVGVAAALALVALTAVDALRDVDDRFPLGLLGVYLRGYEPTPVGTAIGALWAFAVGGAAGWIAAHVRNLVIALALVVTRARLRWLETHDVLDRF